MNLVSLKESTYNVLSAFGRLNDTNGFPPSHREVAKECGIQTNAVCHHIVKLMEIGFLKSEPCKSRSCVVTEAGRAYLKDREPPRYREIEIIEEMTPEIAARIGYKADQRGY